MSGITIQYTIQYLDDKRAACIIATKNKSQTEKVYTIEIPQYKTLDPIQFEISLQNITSLLIPQCNLSYLPNDFNLCNLIELDISYNQFRQVPDFLFYSNPNITKLNISYNRLTDFNLEPKCYKKLQCLNLCSNDICDYPQWIFNSSCSSLEILKLSLNPLIKPVAFLSGQRLIKLFSLEMNNSNLKRYLHFLQEIPNLKYLSVSNNDRNVLLNTIQDMPFKSFASVSTLVELNFSRLGYSYLSEEICELNSLEILNISFNHLSWLPRNFSNLKSLRILNVSNNELLSLPSDIGELNELTELYVSHNLIGTLPESLINLKKLKLLDCYSNDLIEDALLIINKISSLTVLDLEQNSFNTNDDQNYLEMRNNFSEIKNRISGCKLIDISSDDDYNERKSWYDSEDRESELATDIINNQDEEIWDCDNDSIDDDALLVLPRYKFRLIKKPKPYHPSDYINPIYFEDALDDET